MPTEHEALFDLAFDLYEQQENRQAFAAAFRERAIGLFVGSSKSAPDRPRRFTSSEPLPLIGRPVHPSIP
jgi:hypothetical protein